MAKKSTIAGEYIIEIADKGHVDLFRIYGNAKAIMTEIAKKKNFEVSKTWNTRELGRQLVKAFGDGKTAVFEDITVTTLPSKSIEVIRQYDNVKGGLKEVAELLKKGGLDFSYEDGWNTQTFGSKLTDYLAEHKEEADKILVTPRAKADKSPDEETYFRLSLDTVFEVGESVIEKAKNGDQDLLFKMINNRMMMDLQQWSDPITGEECEPDVVIESKEINKGGDVYVDNLKKITDEEGNVEYVFQYPCKAIVVVNGEKIAGAEFQEPERYFGYWYIGIPYSYDEDRVMQELQEMEDEERDELSLEQDMRSLIYEAMEDNTQETPPDCMEAGDMGDGLYISDFDYQNYVVYLFGRQILAYE